MRERGAHGILLLSDVVRVMVLTTYLDESGTHGGDVTVMAGFIADARQWRKFEKRTAKLFSRYRVDIFHTIDVKRSDKDFEGWTVDRKIEFLDEFHHIINETAELGFAAILREEDYKYYLALPWVRKARKDSRYALLFRACMADSIGAALTVGRWKYNNEPKLKVVAEGGAKNANDALRLYNFFKCRFGGATNRALSGLTFEAKADCLPLGAADLFAYSVHAQETGAKPIGTPKGPLKSDKSYSGNLHRIPLTQTILTDLHQQALDIASGKFL